MAQNDEADAPADTLLVLDDLEAFVDGIMAAQMEAYKISGAVVSVVSDGELVFSRGYGYADIDERSPVDPAATLFRIGSTTKLFTWTAVMQLVEQGLIDLDEDINTYLEHFEIPERFGEPVTMAHLMAHTPGFEDRVIGLFARDEEKLRPLGEVLADDLPKRVRPPGTLAAYSNHGVGIAGYIVEQVSGQPWAEYVQEHILDPLGMDGSTAFQPLPDTLSPNMSKGYVYRDGAFVERPFELVPLGPAGTMSATAEDMARFMIAHLQEGAFEGEQILADSTARLMHTRLFGHDDRVSGMAHGFMERHMHGQRLIGHGGSTEVFHTDMLIIPELNGGMFVSYNSEEGAQARSEIVKAFMDRYLASDGIPEIESGEEDPEMEARAAQVAGEYASTRRSHSTLFKAVRLAAPTKVTAQDDGSLLISGLAPDPGATRWIEVEPYIYRERYGTARIVFQADDAGEVTRFFHDGFPPVAYEASAFYETQSFNLWLLGVTFLLFLSTVVAWLVSLVKRKGQSGFAMIARAVAGTAALLFLAFVVLFGMGTGDEAFQLVYGVPPLVQTALTIGIVGTVLAALAAIFLIPVWRSGYWTFWSRLYYSIVVFGLLAFVWFLYFWNLLGHQY